MFSYLLFYFIMREYIFNIKFKFLLNCCLHANLSHIDVIWAIALEVYLMEIFFFITNSFPFLFFFLFFVFFFFCFSFIGCKCTICWKKSRFFAFVSNAKNHVQFSVWFSNCFRLTVKRLRQLRSVSNLFTV